jgi:hypothetical protein
MTAGPDMDGAFQEVFLCGVTKKDGTEVQFAGTMEEFTPEEGEKDGEGIALGNGGRLWKRTPEGDFEITCKLYPLSIDVTDSEDMVQYFLGGTYDAVAPIVQTNTRNRDTFRVAFMWTDFAFASGATATTASGPTHVSTPGRRLTFKHARVTGYKESWDDKVLSVEVTFKGPAFDRTGNGNVMRESVNSSDGTALPTLKGYTAGTKFPDHTN